MGSLLHSRSGQSHVWVNFQTFDITLDKLYADTIIGQWEIDKDVDIQFFNQIFKNLFTNYHRSEYDYNLRHFQSSISQYSNQSAWSARSAVCSVRGLRFGVTNLN